MRNTCFPPPGFMEKYRNDYFNCVIQRMPHSLARVLAFLHLSLWKCRHNTSTAGIVHNLVNKVPVIQHVIATAQLGEEADFFAPTCRKGLCTIAGPHACATTPPSSFFFFSSAHVSTTFIRFEKKKKEKTGWETNGGWGYEILMLSMSRPPRFSFPCPPLFLSPSSPVSLLSFPSHCIVRRHDCAKLPSGLFSAYKVEKLVTKVHQTLIITF